MSAAGVPLSHPDDIPFAPRPIAHTTAFSISVVLRALHDDCACVNTDKETAPSSHAEQTP